MSARSGTGEVTKLLNDWSAGDEAALGLLMDRLYDDLRSLARSHLRRQSPGATLQPTALVHELWMRLARHGEMDVASRRQFFGLASQIMRRMLVDYARRRKARHRELHVTLIDDIAKDEGPAVDTMAIHDVLSRLEAEHPRAYRVVELRCFGGLGLEEVAACLGVATGTVKRDWRFARTWLYHELGAA